MRTSQSYGTSGYAAGATYLGRVREQDAIFVSGGMINRPYYEAFVHSGLEWDWPSAREMKVPKLEKLWSCDKCNGLNMEDAVRCEHCNARRKTPGDVECPYCGGSTQKGLKCENCNGPLPQEKKCEIKVTARMRSIVTFNGHENRPTCRYYWNQYNARPLYDMEVVMEWIDHDFKKVSEIEIGHVAIVHMLNNASILQWMKDYKYSNDPRENLCNYLSGFFGTDVIVTHRSSYSILFRTHSGAAFEFSVLSKNHWGTYDYKATLRHAALSHLEETKREIGKQFVGPIRKTIKWMNGLFK